MRVRTKETLRFFIASAKYVQACARARAATSERAFSRNTRIRARVRASSKLRPRVRDVTTKVSDITLHGPRHQPTFSDRWILHTITRDCSTYLDAIASFQPISQFAFTARVSYSRGVPLPSRAGISFSLYFRYRVRERSF